MSQRNGKISLISSYGGDQTRKMKLLEKQKRGKKKMRMLGQITVDSDTFLALMKNDNK
jgi:GTP-binding protein LepA